MASRSTSHPRHHPRRRNAAHPPRHPTSSTASSSVCRGKVWPPIGSRIGLCKRLMSLRKSPGKRGPARALRLDADWLCAI
eukprot:4684685-Pyramimonas_sp.AAC.1